MEHQIIILGSQKIPSIQIQLADISVCQTPEKRHIHTHAHEHEHEPAILTPLSATWTIIDNLVAVKKLFYFSIIFFKIVKLPHCKFGACNEKTKYNGYVSVNFETKL